MSPRKKPAGVFQPDFSALIAAYGAWLFMRQDGCEGESLIRILEIDGFWIRLAARHSRH
jgi:hypothetical protein